MCVCVRKRYQVIYICLLLRRQVNTLLVMRLAPQHSTMLHCPGNFFLSFLLLPKLTSSMFCFHVILATGQSSLLVSWPWPLASLPCWSWPLAVSPGGIQAKNFSGYLIASVFVMYSHHLNCPLSTMGSTCRSFCISSFSSRSSRVKHFVSLRIFLDA